MKKILVAGGCGFIGCHLCHKLLSQGHQVICLDNLQTGNLDNISNLIKNKNFSFIEASVTKPFFSDVKQIYNLACPASPVQYQLDPVNTTITSVIGSINLLNLATKNNATILQASTSEIYGDPEVHPQTENYLGHVNCIGPRSCYDEGKRAAESLFFDYYRQYQTNIRIIRIFNTYGPKMKNNDGRVVSNFIFQALSNQDITIYGDGSQSRSFQYIDDLIDGMIKMMNNKNNFIGPVNIGNPVEITIKQLAETILQLIPESTSKIIYKKSLTDDPRQRKPDIFLAQKKLNWKPKIKLITGLKKTIRYFKLTYHL